MSQGTTPDTQSVTTDRRCSRDAPPWRPMSLPPSRPRCGQGWLAEEGRPGLGRVRTGRRAGGGRWGRKLGGTWPRCALEKPGGRCRWLCTGVSREEGTWHFREQSRKSRVGGPGCVHSSGQAAGSHATQPSQDGWPRRTGRGCEQGSGLCLPAPPDLGHVPPAVSSLLRSLSPSCGLSKTG